MPWTEKQRRLFHAIAEDPEVAREHGVSTATGRRLAAEADDLSRRGKERKATVKSFIDLSPVFRPSDHG